MEERAWATFVFLPSNFFPSPTHLLHSFKGSFNGLASVISVSVFFSSLTSWEEVSAAPIHPLYAERRSKVYCNGKMYSEVIDNYYTRVTSLRGNRLRDIFTFAFENVGINFEKLFRASYF